MNKACCQVQAVQEVYTSSLVNEILVFYESVVCTFLCRTHHLYECSLITLADYFLLQPFT